MPSKSFSKKISNILSVFEGDYCGNGRTETFLSTDNERLIGCELDPLGIYGYYLHQVDDLKQEV